MCCGLTTTRSKAGFGYKLSRTLHFSITCGSIGVYPRGLVKSLRLFARLYLQGVLLTGTSDPRIFALTPVSPVNTRGTPLGGGRQLTDCLS